MNKSREEIPLWSWYNGQLLFQFDEQLKKNPDMTLSEFFNHFKTDQKIQEMNFYHTKNQGTIVLLLYGLMVIPKEIWEMTNTNFSFKTRAKFIVSKASQNKTTIEFLRLLRNSLAHANFSINTQNQLFTFWNNDGKGNKNFEVKIKYNDLGKFIAEIGKYYINDVTKVKTNGKNI